MKYALILFLCLQCVSARYIPVLVNNPTDVPKRDLIGDLIESSQWFPIEVNVPDTVSNIGQGWTNLSNGFGNFLQGIPIVNRIISQVRPRPFKYLVIVPGSGGDSVPFNPFDNTAGFIPMYP